MADSPKSFADPYWSELAASAAQRHDVPPDLLVSILTKGERSNSDQVSEVGAKTPFQVTPTTRNLVLKRDGVDAYLSDENAADVAARVLKDGMRWATARASDPIQQASLAAGYYHAGGDQANWGTRTRSYIARVMTALPKPGPAASTFERVQASTQPAIPPDAIARVFDAYQAGQLSPEERADFEVDVKAGKVMLPKGMRLQAAAAPAAAAGPDVLPQGVLDAYWGGQMTPEEKAQLQVDVKSGAAKLPPGVQLEAGGTLAGSARASQIPGQDGQPVVQPAAPTPSLGDKVIGAGEAALSTATGMTGGVVGTVAGTVGGLAGAVLDGKFGTPEGAQQVEQAAARGAEAMTYAPRTPAGQSMTAGVGDVMGNVLPAGAVLPSLAGTARPVAPAARGVLTEAQQAVKAKVEAAAARRAQAAANDPSATPTPGTMGSVGAAGTDIATIRRTNAQELPVPIELTKGQAERTFEQQRFEAEMAKDPLKGQPLRDRAAEQHAQVWQNFDQWLDDTGAQKFTSGEVGDTVKSALAERAQADKNRVRAAYKQAEKAGELEQPVNLDSVVSYLNESAPDASTAPLLSTARQWAIKLGIAEDQNGTLVPVHSRSGSSLMNEQPTGAVTLRRAEVFRQAINRNTDFEPTNIRQATILKGLVDQATDGMGGNLYREARGLRARYAQNYENIGLVYDLMNNKKGMRDSTVAAEDVFRRSILSGKMEEVKQLRRILQTGGESGQQAWKELQGATLRYIRDEAARNVSRNERGQEMVSPKGLDSAISSLDKTGKLDFIFGKRGSEQLRALNDLSKVLFTAPPGAVNTSNTASVILAALDIATSGIAGMPLPIMSGLRILTTHVKDRQIQRRINEALGIKPEAKKAKPARTPPTNTNPASRAPESRTVH